MSNEGFLAPDLALHNLNNPAETQVAVIGLPTSSSVAVVSTHGPFVSTSWARPPGRWKHIYLFTMTNRLVLRSSGGIGQVLLFHTLLIGL